MAVHWKVSRREPYAGGASFGAFGPFEIIEGRARYAVDPAAPRNAGVVDLPEVPRDADGLVRFSGDYTLIAPRRGAAQGLLIDVPNRGRRLAFSQFNRAGPAELLEDPCAVGDGFVFRHGLALASIGWQWDALNGLALDAPLLPVQQAELDAPASAGDVVCRIQPGSDRPFASFGQLGEVAYPPLVPDDPEARLFVREDDNAPHVEIPRAAWRFGRERRGRLEPSDRYIHKDGGFEKGRIYTLVYPGPGEARVAGCGLLALRDAAASLRTGEGPTGATFASVFAFGASQTGRVLRHLLYLGLNVGERGERVFDGVHIHIAGGQRGDFNHRFAQPSSAGVPAVGQRFPFAGMTTTDPLTGIRDGLYARLPDAAMPKVVITNTSWEYWRGDAALTHVSADGGRDLVPHPAERNYLLAGTHHVGGVLPPTNTFAVTGEKARYTFNMVDHSPLVRAAFANLVAWVLEGRVPPASAVPTLADGALVDRAAVLGKFAGLRGFKGLDADRLGGLSVLDLGPDAQKGICAFPAIEGERYARLVSDVDETLNECAGIRLPDIAVPIGCHTGWNPRHPDHGAPSLPAIFVGFTRFMEDLPDAESYEERVRLWTRHLVAQRLVLEEDAERVVGNALRRLEIARGLEGRR